MLDKLISAVFVELLRGDTHELSSCQDLIRNLRINDQMNLLDGMLHILSGRFADARHWLKDSAQVKSFYSTI